MISINLSNILKNKKYILILSASAIILITLFIAIFCYIKYFDVVKRDIIIDIPDNSSARKICRILKDNSVVPSECVIIFLIKISGSDKTLKYGRYKFYQGMSYFEVFDVIRSGKIIEIKVTIPEGFNIYDIGERLEELGIVTSKNKFIDFCTDKDKVKDYINNGVSLEGYLFPDTYNFYPNEPISRIVSKMNRNFNDKVLPLFDNVTTIFVNDAVILASIVQKETSDINEMPLVSSVFFNRINLKMKLQSDPTVIYGLWPNINKPLLRSDLNADTPYNTYKIDGLPPTPICNPGIEAIKAVLLPANKDFLYFVADNEGGHIFSKKYSQHLINVKKSRRERKKATK